MLKSLDIIFVLGNTFVFGNAFYNCLVTLVGLIFFFIWISLLIITCLEYSYGFLIWLFVIYKWFNHCQLMLTVVFFLHFCLERGAKPVTNFVKNLSALSDWYSIYTSAIAFIVSNPTPPGAVRTWKNTLLAEIRWNCHIWIGVMLQFKLYQIVWFHLTQNTSSCHFNYI